MINEENIGKYIRTLRKQKGLSQEKLAEELGMYQADISNLERAVGGSGITDICRLDSIADYFGIALVELLYGAPLQAAAAEEPKKLPESSPEDIYQLDYADLSVVYRYRLVVETDMEYPSVYSDFDDFAQQEKAILAKLKAACASEEAYQVWKKDLIDAKVRQVTEKKKIVVCSYLFAGMGSYKEIMPEEEVESFQCWIDQNGSAFFGGSRPATKKEVRAYVSQHIADELMGGEAIV